MCSNIMGKAGGSTKAQTEARKLDIEGKKGIVYQPHTLSLQGGEYGT
jgi:hypothetical protein